MEIRLFLFLFVVISSSCVIADDLNWWKSAVIYQIYPRSFRDSDGNGVGDLQGIIDNVDYIKELGVDAIWLTPIYPTEDKDFGYDITDMKNIYSLLGNMTIFDNLIKKIHDAGMRLIMDFVPNHTSNKHDWFIKSIKGSDKYRDYYVWLPGSTDLVSSKMRPPNNWVCGISDGSAWTFDNFRKQYYLHQFLPEQPDLNYENEDVVHEMLSVLEFWLNKGVDGFRMDAVYTMCEKQTFQDENPGPHGERNHEYTFDQPKTFEILARFRNKLDEYTNEDNKTRLMMIENYNSNPNIIKKYYGNEELGPIAHFPFNFYLIMNLTKNSNATDWANCINEWYKVMGDENHPNWVLGNHDQHRVSSRYTSDYVDLLNIIVLSLKGTAITYYGEEIGMPDSLVRMDQAQDPQGKNVSYQDFLWKSRDPERGPFLWNQNSTSGFSSSFDPWIPVSSAYWKLNVKAQNESDRSHLKIYKEMVALRKNLTIKYGKVEVTNYNDSILSIFRSYEDNLSVVIVVNFGTVEETVDLTKKRVSLPEVLYFYTASLNINDFKDKDNKWKTYKSASITLPPKGALVLTTQPLK